MQNNLIDNIPGAEGLPHTRLPEASHFLQDDQGAEIARRIVDLIEST
jgi:haloalkane dehalogenase